MKKSLMLMVAIVSGVVAAVLAHVHLSLKSAEIDSSRRALMARYGTMDVIVFNKDVPSGTEIERGDLGEITVPKAGLRNQALTRENLQDVIGRKTLVAHQRGDVLFWSDVEGGDPRAVGLSEDIKRSMRAISVPVDGSSSVSGMIRPGDHVDVIGTFSFPKPGGGARDLEAKALTILQNVLVLATGTETAKRTPSGNAPLGGYALVTLEVTPREAEMLSFTQQMRGRLVLTLRNRNDTTYERELPEVDFERIKGEMGELNLKRQQKFGGR